MQYGIRNTTKCGASIYKAYEKLKSVGCDKYEYRLFQYLRK